LSPKKSNEKTFSSKLDLDGSNFFGGTADALPPFELPATGQVPSIILMKSSAGQRVSMLGYFS
jgi:hypothetical protein